jgi:hypothetical protein
MNLINLIKVGWFESVMGSGSVIFDHFFVAIGYRISKWFNCRDFES